LNSATKAATTDLTLGKRETHPSETTFKSASQKALFPAQKQRKTFPKVLFFRYWFTKSSRCKRICLVAKFGFQGLIVALQVE